MIEFASKKVSDFLTFLDQQYPVKSKIKVSVLHGFDSVAVGEDEAAFAVYVSEPKQRYMLIAGSIPRKLSKELKEDNQSPDDFICRSIAHEYYHFLRDIDAVPAPDFKDEEEAAETFANLLVLKYLAQGR